MVTNNQSNQYLIHISTEDSHTVDDYIIVDENSKNIIENFRKKFLSFTSRQDNEELVDHILVSTATGQTLFEIYASELKGLALTEKEHVKFVNWFNRQVWGNDKKPNDPRNSIHWEAKPVITINAENIDLPVVKLLKNKLETQKPTEPIKTEPQTDVTSTELELETLEKNLALSAFTLAGEWPPSREDLLEDLGMLTPYGVSVAYDVSVSDVEELINYHAYSPHELITTKQEHLDHFKGIPSRKELVRILALIDEGVPLEGMERYTELIRKYNTYRGYAELIHVPKKLLKQAILKGYGLHWVAKTYGLTIPEVRYVIDKADLKNDPELNQFNPYKFPAV